MTNGKVQALSNLATGKPRDDDDDDDAIRHGGVTGAFGGQTLVELDD